MTKLIFIAGPYSAANAWTIEGNIRAAEEAALEVAEAGFVPVCTHSMYRYFYGTLPESFWRAAALELLARCDAVLLLPDWELSEGAREEHAEAMRRNMPCSVQLSALREAFEEEAALIDEAEEAGVMQIRAQAEQYGLRVFKAEPELP